ncbi:MAG: hypothetical protein FJY38_07575 [Betaproteobacteria bacterium]|nr:hypothetical protein [Betaproteobacteria bacterium]
MSESAGLRISRRGGWWLLAVSALGIAGGLYRVMHEPAGSEVTPVVVAGPTPDRPAPGVAIPPIPKPGGVEPVPSTNSETNRPLAGIPVAPPAPPGRTNALGTASQAIAPPPVVAVAPSTQAPNQAGKSTAQPVESRASVPSGPASSTVISNREVEQATEDWRKAWSARQLNTYLAFYGGGFPNRASFIRRKTSIIQAASSIEVVIDNLKVSVNGNEARVQFRQSYKSDSFQSVDQKELVWVRENGRLVIVAENGRD